MNVVWVRGMKVKFRCEDARAWLGWVVGGICGREPYPGRSGPGILQKNFTKNSGRTPSNERGGSDQSDTGYALPWQCIDEESPRPGVEDPPLSLRLNQALFSV